MVAGLEAQEAEVRRCQAALRETYRELEAAIQESYGAGIHHTNVRRLVDENYLRAVDADIVKGSNETKRLLSAKDAFPDMYAQLDIAYEAKSLADHKVKLIDIRVEALRAELRTLEILYGQPTWQREH